MSTGIVEIKSMADFAFERAKKGIIEHDYLCQAWIYFKGTDFNPVVFLAYRKETSHMVEIVFDRNQREKIVKTTLTQDPIEIAKTDPITLTEIKSPFDESVEEYVRERIKWLKEVKRQKEKGKKEDGTFDFSLLTFDLMTVPGADAVEDEVEKVQGEKKAFDRMLELGDGAVMGDKSGSWYSIKTGRKILGYPCSYCAHMERCFPTAQMEMKGDRPIWVLP